MVSGMLVSMHWFKLGKGKADEGYEVEKLFYNVCDKAEQARLYVTPFL